MDDRAIALGHDARDCGCGWHLVLHAGGAAPWSRTVSALGAGLALVGLDMFIAPELFFDHWAWQLTPLTGRITGAVLTLPGLVDIGMLRDARWSSFRLIFQAQLVSLAFIIGAFIIASGDLELARPMTWLVVGGIAATAVGYVGIYVWCERKVAAKNR